MRKGGAGRAVPKPAAGVKGASFVPGLLHSFPSGGVFPLAGLFLGSRALCLAPGLLLGLVFFFPTRVEIKGEDGTGVRLSHGRRWGPPVPPSKWKENLSTPSCRKVESGSLGDRRLQFSILPSSFQQSPDFLIRFGAAPSTSSGVRQLSSPCATPQPPPPLLALPGVASAIDTPG